MPRTVADFRLSIKDKRTGRLTKLELVRTPFRGRFFVRKNGKNDGSGTATEISAAIRELIKW